MGDEDGGGCDVESATDIVYQVDGEMNVGCDCCPGGVCSATEPNVVVNDFSLLQMDPAVDEDSYEGWARYEHKQFEWKGSMSIDIDKQDPESAFALGRWMERLENRTEGECQCADRNVREPAWVTDDGPQCPLCGHWLEATYSHDPCGELRFLVQCPDCRYDHLYTGDDAVWAADAEFGW